MPGLLAARAQMGTSLAFHIIFSVLGVGLPLLLCIAEGLGLWRKDPVWMVLARRWARAAVIIFAIGAVSGTIVDLELGLLWPTYIRFIGAVIGPLFAFEGFAFFLEANFLRRLLVWLESSFTRCPLVVFISHLDWRPCFSLVYCNHQFLDEYANRF
jgi:cytochrome d ubiquinol oxidase subunit I